MNPVQILVQDDLHSHGNIPMPSKLLNGSPGKACAQYEQAVVTRSMAGSGDAARMNAKTMLVHAGLISCPL